MYTKEAVLKSIKNIITDNNMSIYNIANIAGINRSTLQKSLSGDRYLNLRQFNSLINVLPISNTEKDYFYKKYLNLLWDKDKIRKTNAVLDILKTINNNIDKTAEIHFDAFPRIELNSITGRQNIVETIKNVTIASVSDNKQISIYAYTPLLYNSIISHCTNSFMNKQKNISVSILFEFLKPGSIDRANNLTILKNILPALLNNQDTFTFHYIYVDSYFYENHLTPYPYYIIYPDVALLLSSEQDTLIAVTDKNVIEDMINTHQKNINKSNSLNTFSISFNDSVTTLMSGQVSSNMYAITYSPCITSFVPPTMYSDLISDDFPDKENFLNLVANRIEEISSTSKKYVIFNADSIKEFEETGRLLMFDHPCLKRCTIPQRIEILSNILNTIDDTSVVARAFTKKALNISGKFEITNVQDLHSFDILVYHDNGNVSLIDIREPIISNYFIDFIQNALDTPLVYTFEETKQLISDSIDRLNKQLQ